MASNIKDRKKYIFSTQNLVMMALLVAIQIVLSRYFSIQTPTLRVGFGTVPVTLAGMWLGPLPGAIVALLSDMLGTILSGYGAYFFPLSLGSISKAVICGIGTRYIFRSPLVAKGDGWKVILINVVGAIFNSFIIGVPTLTWYQIAVAGTEGSFWTLAGINFAQRLATRPVTIAINTLIVYLINKALFNPVISRIVRY